MPFLKICDPKPILRNTFIRFHKSYNISPHPKEKWIGWEVGSLPHGDAKAPTSQGREISAESTSRRFRRFRSFEVCRSSAFRPLFRTCSSWRTAPQLPLVVDVPTLPISIARISCIHPDIDPDVHKALYMNHVCEIRTSGFHHDFGGLQCFVCLIGYSLSFMIC